MADSIVGKKSFEFALRIINLYKELKDEKEFIISKQLLKSGTSIGANIQEALCGQSSKDFIGKLSISLKEAKETKYWLLLLKESKLTQLNVETYLNDLEELLKLLSSIIITSKDKLK
jgi:four helix bundle protein